MRQQSNVHASNEPSNELASIATSTEPRPWLAKWRCSVLLAALLSLLALYPTLGAQVFVGTVLLDLLASAVLVAAVYATAQRPWQLTLALVLCVPTLLGRWLGVDQDGSVTGVLLASTEIGFFALSVLLVFGYVLSGHAHIGDRIAGALSVYLLIGVMFAEIYLLVEAVAPGSLASARPALAWQDLLYFSFVTLTTLGYGDITPATAQAEALVITESVIGVFYLAVLVAWLVSSLGAADRAAPHRALSQVASNPLPRDS